VIGLALLVNGRLRLGTLGEERTDRDGLAICLKLKRSPAGPWHLCDLLSIRGTPAQTACSDPCLARFGTAKNGRSKKLTTAATWLRTADGDPATVEGDAAVTIYHVTLRDRETQTVVGYYNGTWTTDPRRALTLRWREAAEAQAARMRDRCPRNAKLIAVEEIAAAD